MLSRRSAALLPVVALVLSCMPLRASKASFHIGVCTPTVAQSEDTLRGAEQLIKEYVSVTKGGMIRHVTFPDDFMSQQETVITSLVSLADDPRMKVVVASEAIPGVGLPWHP
jgi:hypothetical protein